MPSHGFALKINPAGNELVWSTYLRSDNSGGNVNDFANAIAVDSEGRAYVGGETESGRFPLLDCFVADAGGGWVLALTPDGSALSFGTYLGDRVVDLEFGPSGDLYVAGGASTLPGVELPGPLAFVARIDPASPTPASPGSIHFDTRSVEVMETAGVASLTVRRSCGSQGAVSLGWRLEAGTALPGVNYAPGGGTVAFAAGDTAPKTIQVPILDDGVLSCEDPLSFGVSFDPATATGGVWPGNRPSGVAIKDDSQVPIVEKTFQIYDPFEAVGPAWAATTNESWLTLDTYAGVGPSTVRVRVDVTGLSPGDYQGLVTVTSPGAVEQRLEVYLHVQPGFHEGERPQSLDPSRSKPSASGREVGR